MTSNPRYAQLETMTIPRSIFQSAIEAGIERAAIDSDTAERLRDVGRMATSFGDNYGTGCPWALAYPESAADDIPPGGRSFAHGFDCALADLGGVVWLTAPERFTVA